MRWAALLAIVLLAVLGGAAFALSASGGSRVANSASPAAASLGCSVKPSCGVGEVAVFRMSSTSNAHASTPGGSSYGNVVCCGGVHNLSAACSATYDSALTLSSAGNAHAAADGTYATQVCLSVPHGVADCTYGPSCGADYRCLATVSDSSNAHVADCDGVGDYATRLCCYVEDDNDNDGALDPSDADDDEDSMPDTYELSNVCLNQWAADGMTNSDGDVLFNYGEMFIGTDPCLANPELAVDSDGDAYNDGRERYMNTDRLDACPDVLGTPGLCPGPSCDGDDAWPLDVDVNRQVNIADVFKYKGKIGKSVGNPDYAQRLDLDASGSVNIADVFLYKGNIGHSCTNP